MGSSSFSFSSSSSSSSYGSLSTSDPESGFYGYPSHVPYPPPSSLSSSRPRRLFYDVFDEDDDDEDYEPRHFLDFCALCRKPLARDCDIFMYRGDTPFCSDQCRQEQIEIDEAKEKSWKKLPVKASAGSRKEQHKSKSRKILVRAGNVVTG